MRVGVLRLVALCLTSGLLRAAPYSVDASLSTALHLLYDSQFEASRESLRSYSLAHPAAALPYALTAATYLFSEMDRTGALKHGLLNDDRTLSEAKPTGADPANRSALDAAAKEAREHAATILAGDPRNRDALLAMCLVSGVQRDYLALVEHRLRESYEYIRESQSYASRLLKADPTAYDAYLTKGFTEYLVASLPFYLRWFMKFDDINVTKKQGLQDLRVAADSGCYMKPFAQMMLAMLYLREKQEGQTEKLLTQLSLEYPDNPAFRIELERLELNRRSSTN